MLFIFRILLLLFLLFFRYSTKPLSSPENNSHKFRKFYVSTSPAPRAKFQHLCETFRPTRANLQHLCKTFRPPRANLQHLCKTFRPPRANLQHLCETFRPTRANFQHRMCEQEFYEFNVDMLIRHSKTLVTMMSIFNSA